MIVQEYVLPDPYRIQDGTVQFENLIYLPQRNRALASSPLLSVVFSLSLTDVTDIKIYDIQNSPLWLTLLSDDRILAIFANVNSDRKIIRLNKEVTSVDISTHTKAFPGTREMTAVSIHNIYPNRIKNPAEAIYIVMVNENVLEVVKESDGMF